MTRLYFYDILLLVGLGNLLVAHILAFKTTRIGPQRLPTNCATTMHSTTSSMSSSVPSSYRLGYVTDVEGNLDYFLRYVEQSKVLQIRELTPHKLLLDLQTQGEDCYFVYGGDAVDKGPGDIQLVRALVDLKHRYPDWVFLLVGNRDLNKLQFSAELAANNMARPISDIPPPHWDPKAPSLLEYLTTKANEQQSTVEILNTRVNQLHYLLEHTLGCPKTFEFQQEELAILQDAPNKSYVSDDQVLQSFLDEVERPEGSLRQYLECASVSVNIGNTLFCHGAVDINTMKYVPQHDTKFENPTSKPPAAAMVENAEDWTNALNHYLTLGLQDYQARLHWNTDCTSRGGESLMALQN